MRIPSKRPTPVVQPASAPDGILVELPHAGNGLARVDEPRSRSGNPRDVLTGRRGDARETLEVIQRGSLARQDRRRSTADLGQFGTRSHGVSVRHQGFECEFRVAQAKDFTRDVHTANDKILLGNILGPSLAPGFNRGSRGEITAADVFVDGGEQLLPKQTEIDGVHSGSGAAIYGPEPHFSLSSPAASFAA